MMRSREENKDFGLELLVCHSQLGLKIRRICKREGKWNLLLAYAVVVFARREARC